MVSPPGEGAGIKKMAKKFHFSCYFFAIFATNYNVGVPPTK